MGTISRGVQNAFRNNLRTVAVVLILGVSMGLALAMLVARNSVSAKIQSVKQSVGNTITITPAGVEGFQGGGEPLTTQQIAKVTAQPHVKTVLQTLNDRLTTTNSSLKSALDAGSLGARASNNSGVGFRRDTTQGQQNRFGSSQPDVVRTFTPPVSITGVSSADDSSIYGGNTVTFTSGAAFDAAASKNVGAIGKALAEKNSLKVGSTFTAYNAKITVVGIYDTGNTFANAGLVMPLGSLQKLSGQANNITRAVATIDSVDNLDSTLASTKSVLGSAADVVSNQENAKQTVQPLESVRNISLFSLIGAVIAGAVIILLIMAMIVRERRREIGVLKAIGATNKTIVLQFVAEAITLTLCSLVVGVALGTVSASPITKTLVNNSSSQNQSTPNNGPAGFPPRAGRFRIFNNDGAVADIKNVKTLVDANILGYGLGVAILIAIVGSAMPAYLISKVRPSEVMRAD